MKNKRIASRIFTVILVSALFGIVACTPEGSEFDGSRTSNESQFIVDFDYLHMSLTHDMDLVENDTIDVDITVESGEVDIFVTFQDQSSIYTGNDASTGEFSLPITQAGSYTFEVAGTKASGYISFIKR